MTQRTSRRRSAAVIAVLALVTAVAGAPSAGATTLLNEQFSSFPLSVPWLDGTVHGNWDVQYTGYGLTTIALDGSNALSQIPLASLLPGETHAGFVTSVGTYGDIDLRLSLRTVAQLRILAPNPWEVAWVVWNHQSDGHFTYLVLKPNGWELGKVDDTRAVASGPACVWPSYQNCRYPGAQRYLATGSSPKFPIGPWYAVRVRQVGATVTAWVGGVRLVRFTDTENPYTGGSIGLYTEDAAVHFDSVVVATP